jgi:stress response protein YsnF
MQRRNQNALEIDLELATQELLAPFNAATDSVEVDDLAAAAATLDDAAASAAANSRFEAGETMEIELTAEQIDALLEGRWL